jgi:hypothetical protein
MQGKSDPKAELLDAAALCRQLVPDASMYAMLADHRLKLFPDELFADLRGPVGPAGCRRPALRHPLLADPPGQQLASRAHP